MDAIDLLESQHDEVKDLFEQIEGAALPAEKFALFQKIADNLAAHATIEEKIFYPAIYTGELNDKLYEAVEEHLAAKRIVADVLEMGDASDEDVFTAKVKVLKEEFEHHVEQEEGDMFQRMRETMSDRELEMYGAQMEAMFVELMQGDPRNDFPNETAQAAPPPK